MEQNNKKTESVDELFRKIDEIAQNLERDDIGLEESFRLYQEGMKLLKDCGEKIDRVEKQFMILDENGEGYDE